MKKYGIYLQSTDPNSDKKMRLFFGISGFIYLSIGIIIYYFIHSLFDNYSFGIIFGTLSLILAFGYKKFVKRCFIKFDDQGIESAQYKNDKTGIGSPFLFSPEKFNVKWEDIQSIDIRPLKININLHDGSKKEIELGGLMYKQHQSLKAKLQEYIQVKVIKIDI